MHTSWSQDGLSDVPLSCTLCLVQEEVIGTGWLWEFSSTRGLFQSPLLASPGMVVKVSFQLPARAPIRLDGLVIWARESEFGIKWLPSPLIMTEKGGIYETW